MNDNAVFLPDLRRLPAQQWRLLHRSASSAGQVGSGPFDPSACPVGGAVLLGSLPEQQPVPLDEQLAAVVGHPGVGEAALDRAVAGHTGVESGWRSDFEARWLAAREDDFVGHFVNGVDQDGPAPIWPNSEWTEPAAGADPVGRTPVVPTDHLDAVLDQGRGDVGYVVRRRDGKVESQWADSRTVVATYQQWARELAGQHPSEEELRYRERMAEVPATITAEPLVVSLVEQEDEDEPLEVVAVAELPRLSGTWRLWARQSMHPAVGDVTDVLLLAPDESRGPDEVFAALEPLATPFAGGDGAPSLRVGPALADDAGDGVDLSWFDGPMLVHDGGVSFGDPDNVGFAHVATDGCNVLVGEWRAQDAGTGFAEWVAGEGEAEG